MGRLIHRLVWKAVEPAGATVAEAPLGGGSWRVEVYRVRLLGLIVQRPGVPDALLHRGPVALAPGPWREYCRWHSGPLHERDDPTGRIYCDNPVKPGAPFCRQHRRTPRAVYEACFSTSGPHSLEACRQLDSMERGEYAVYLLDYGGQRLKVGATRAWRAVDRAAEQPHAAATVIAVYDSALHARRAEMLIARSGIASERPHRARRPHRPPLAPAAARLAAAAERAARLLGVEWEGRIYTVEPPWNAAPPTLEPERLAGKTLEPAAYWGGLLAIKTGGALVAVEERRLSHRDSLEEPQGAPGP